MESLMPGFHGLGKPGWNFKSVIFRKYIFIWKSHVNVFMEQIDWTGVEN